LVLDEDTVALNNVTEPAVITAVGGLSRVFTIVMIAHRLSTVAGCDHVIRLENGRLAAQGSPSLVLDSH
jgi:ABC-type transport system involved in Fe-S cluster assembly fused permease/ATPase subunit